MRRSSVPLLPVAAELKNQTKPQNRNRSWSLPFVGKWIQSLKNHFQTDFQEFDFLEYQILLAEDIETQYGRELCETLLEEEIQYELGVMCRIATGRKKKKKKM